MPFSLSYAWIKQRTRLERVNWARADALDRADGIGSSEGNWIEREENWTERLESIEPLERAARSTRAGSIQNTRLNHGGSIVAEQVTVAPAKATPTPFQRRRHVNGILRSEQSPTSANPRRRRRACQWPSRPPPHHRACRFRTDALLAFSRFSGTQTLGLVGTLEADARVISAFDSPHPSPHDNPG
ncbi:hypothetical protein DFH09DRAFT_1110389 [Mycena vulgaris]|nr:hypothetical protein DFH09DRAFT_1110389 [Mycena vulgaris]